MKAAYAPSTWGSDAPYLQVDRAYNPRGLLTGLTNSLVSATGTLTALSTFSGLSYDADGNRLGETAAIPARGSAPNLSRTLTYGYDLLDELTGETSSGSAAGLTYTHTWAYDLSGNPTTTRTGSATYNADNQNTALAYTGNGDPLMLPVFTTTETATFDPEDRLTQTGANSDFYARYDGDGLRAWSYPAPGSPSYYLYDGDQPVAEVDYTGTQLAYTMSGASGTEFRYQNYDTALADSAGTAYTFDPQGSAVQPVTLYLPGTFPNVKVRSSSAFDAFGLLQAAATADVSDAFDPFGFGGQAGYYRDYSGLYFLTHRYFDAGAGRFVTRDPIGYQGGINLYGFVGNNPVNDSDPSGYDSASSVRGDFPANPEGDGWFPLSWSQARARAIHNWNATPGRLAAAGENLLQVVQHLDNSECGCSEAAGPVQYRNGYRTPNGKFAKPGGAEPPAGEPQADAVAESIMRKRGFTVVGREVTVKANGLERRYDIVVQGRSGNLIGVEVKSGTSPLTASQRAFDQALNRSGTATVQAVGKYKGLAIRRTIVIRRP